MQATDNSTAAAVDLSWTVGQMVAAHPSWAGVFEKWGIDYCCGGKKPLPELCERKQVPLQRVLDDLMARQSQQATATETDWAQAPLGQLADHIEATHHAYLRSELPRLAFIVDKVHRVHGVSHPELAEVHGIFSKFRDELESHMMKEERVLFPLIRLLDGASAAPSFHCGSVSNPIRVMEAEHGSAGSAMEQIRALTHDYQPPRDACNTYRVMLHALAVLEADLHQHVHKENNILFPRAIAAESALATGA